VPRQESADPVTPPYYIAGGQRRDHGLEARHKPIRMPDRQHRPIHDHSDEIHHAGGRRIHGRSGRGRDIDAAVTGTVRRRGGDERPHHPPGRIDWPLPVLAYGRGCRSRGGRRGRPQQWRHECERGNQTDKPDRSCSRERHAPIVRRGIRAACPLTAECGMLAPGAACGGEALCRSAPVPLAYSAG
jgi:hypothetical protein